MILFLKAIWYKIFWAILTCSLLCDEYVVEQNWVKWSKDIFKNQISNYGPDFMNLEKYEKYKTL